MPLTTNSLVTRKSLRRFAAPASLAAVAVLGSAMVLHGTGVHANAISASALDDQSVSSLSALDHDMETLAARVTPAVVNVAVTSRGGSDEDEDAGNTQQQIDPQDLPPQLRQFFGFGGGDGGNSRGGRRAAPQQEQLRRGVGSGVIISPDGYIVTNNHVVEGATQIKITLHDRRVLTGKVVGTDKLTDIAVVKVDAHDLPAITWGDSSKLQPGQTVLAFGSPFGVLQFSVTRGIVSALNRSAMGSDARTPGGLIQTDAAVNPGNSGGPLVNVHGELVGINQMIATNSGQFAGASFAIPSSTAKAIAQEIIATGAAHHGYLGISMNDVTPENAQYFNLKDALGAIVAQVSPNSPAANAGLKNGDVITSLNGRTVENGGALQVDVAQMTPGTKAELGILRNGASQHINVTLGEYKKDAQVAGNDGDGSAGQTNGGKLGLAMSDLTPDVRQQMNIPADVKGAAVAQVRPGSPAEDAGLQPGDVIQEVNRKATPSANDVVSSIHAVPTGKGVLLLVWSNGGASYRVVNPNQG